MDRARAGREGEGTGGPQAEWPVPGPGHAALGPPSSVKCQLCVNNHGAENKPASSIPSQSPVDTAPANINSRHKSSNNVSSKVKKKHGNNDSFV